MLSRLSRGERYVMVAGGFLILSLAFFPWHRAVVVGFFGSGAVKRTALQSPNALQGTVAFLITVAMVAQIVMARYTNQKVNPALARLQAPAGLAVLGVLAWKLAALTDSLSVGAYLGILLAATLAYGGLTMARDGGRRR